MEQEKSTYTYVALTEEERAKVNSIKQDYLPKEEQSQESKMQKLLALDAKVKNPPVIIGLVLGIVGTLIFGLGLTTVLEWDNLILGIIISAVGVLPMLIAYPAYKIVLKNGKKKYGKEIVKLSEEILNSNN